MSYYTSLEAARSAKQKLTHYIRELTRKLEDIEYDLAESENLLEFTDLEILKMMRPEDLESDRDTKMYLFENAEKDVELHAILRNWIESYDERITLMSTGAIALTGGEEFAYYAELLLTLKPSDNISRQLALAIDKMSLQFSGNRELKIWIDTEADENYVLQVKNGTGSLYREDPDGRRREEFTNLRTLEALEYIHENIIR